MFDYDRGSTSAVCDMNAVPGIPSDTALAHGGAKAAINAYTGLTVIVDIAVFHDCSGMGHIDPGGAPMNG